MKTLRLLLGDQLNAAISSLRDADKANDTLLLCEVIEEATYVPHHPKKIAFLFSAMRHFADELREGGFDMRYVQLDDPENQGSLFSEVERILRETKAARLCVTEPGEYRLMQEFSTWSERLGKPVDIVPDDRFFCSREQFSQWFSTAKQKRMEYFYRLMRTQTGLLMEMDGSPIGGQWNYDKENRKPPAAGLSSPRRVAHKKSALTIEVLSLVKRLFADHYGALEPFHFAVTRGQALLELDHFITYLLPSFGDYQDAMVDGEPYLFHSLLSCYLNAGLLLPQELCEAAEAAYHEGAAPLNAVEGFIRQILGWREFVRGVYWHTMPGYGERNYFAASQPLPEFYWTGNTQMRCVSQAVQHTMDHAYSHHIQRLMVTGNFALLAGIAIDQVCAWYLAVYADAYEWVEMPNTLGMALFADGGMMGSKPYAASGKYIHRMSNFCEHCSYNPNKTVGDKACPFNALYWDFLMRHQPKLKVNPRLYYTYATLQRMNTEKQKSIRDWAAVLLKRMHSGEL